MDAQRPAGPGGGADQEEPESHRPRRRRWPRAVAGALAAVLAIAGALTAVFQLGLPWWMGEHDHNHVHRSEAGSQRYQVHLPPEHDGRTELPVVMAIHGCGMTGYGWNSMKSSTQLNELSDREGFIVVYPTQRMFRSPINCWNSADPREQHRGAGEPALLAGVAREVVHRYGGDPSQVHVTGASSGAGAAVVLGVTYPDVFASVTSVAGGEYALNQVDADDPDGTPPEYTARQAWSQMGDRARHVPLMVIQGEQDDVVPPIVATRLLRHWTVVNDLVDNGRVDGSLDLTTETRRTPESADRYAYTYTSYGVSDTTLIESYLVEGMGHVWPGPDGEGRYTDPAGPDATELVWDFAQRHPMS